MLESLGAGYILTLTLCYAPGHCVFPTAPTIFINETTCRAYGDSLPDSTVLHGVTFYNNGYTCKRET